MYKRQEYILSIDEVKDKLAGDDNFKLVSIRSRDEFLGGTSGYGYIEMCIRDRCQHLSNKEKNSVTLP